MGLTIYRYLKEATTISHDTMEAFMVESSWTIVETMTVILLTNACLQVR